MTDSSSDRIVAVLKAWIAQAAPGAQLPSTRALVSEHGASPVTVQKALRTLAAAGLVETRPGVGTFVCRTAPPKPHDFRWQTSALGAPRIALPQTSAAMRVAGSDDIALHSGYPDHELLPERLVRSALTRAARSDHALAVPPGTGLPELRMWFASELAQAAHTTASRPAAGDVIILPGSQTGLTTLFRSLAGPGEPVLIESPTYWGAILAAAQTGVRLMPVPSGPAGPSPADVDAAFARTGATAFYAQPNFANPTGAQWSARTAQSILDTVRAHGAFLIEDDWAHDLGIIAESTPLAARDDSGHVVYLRSLTKSVSPAIRVAALIARGPARERIAADCQAQSMYVSPVLQRAALEVVTQPAWHTHVRGLARQLRGRRDLLAAALREHAPAAHLEAVPAGGLHLWVRLPDGVDLGGFVRACADRGVIVAPGDEWFPAEPTGAHLRLNYSGPNPGAFAQAAAVIGELLDG